MVWEQHLPFGTGCGAGNLRGASRFYVHQSGRRGVKWRAVFGE